MHLNETFKREKLNKCLCTYGLIAKYLKIAVELSFSFEFESTQKFQVKASEKNELQKYCR